MPNTFISSASGLAFGLAVLGAGPAFADNRDTILAECAKQLQLSSSGCTCIADRADDELNGIQQELLIAIVTENREARADLLSRIDPGEMNEVIAFTNSAPQTCAAQ